MSLKPSDHYNYPPGMLCIVKKERGPPILNEKLLIFVTTLLVLGDIFHLLRFMVANESERICPFVPVELKMSSGSVTFVSSLSLVMHGDRGHNSSEFQNRSALSHVSYRGDRLASLC